MTRTTLMTGRGRMLTIPATVLAVLTASRTQAAMPAPVPPKVEQAPSLVHEVATQIELAYRMHVAERQLRQEQLAAAVNAWRAAPRNEANNERLNLWLRAAIRSSMPGSREALPPLPIFAVAGAQHAAADTAKHALAPIATTANKPTPAKPVSTTPAAKSDATPQHSTAADPFRDDPADAQ